MSCQIPKIALKSIQDLKTKPSDYFGYICQLLEACIASKSLTWGKIIHQNLLKYPHFHNKSNSAVLLLLDKFTKLFISCNKPELAQRVFNSIPISERQNKVILWNQLMRAYAWEGPFRRAIDLYYDMVQCGVQPTKYTYPFVLKACAALKDVETGVKIHDDARKQGLDSDVYVCTALVDFYVKCWCLNEAREVFDDMPQRDVVAWNAMISGCSLHGRYHDVSDLVVKMQEMEVTPDPSTFVAILPIIGEENELTVGRSVHGFCLRRGFDGDVVVGTGILDMYGKCQRLVYARRIFGAMKFKNEVTWSAMIGACVTCDSTQEGFEYFERMRMEDGASPSPVTLGIVIRGAAKLNDLNLGMQKHGYSIKLGTYLDLMVGNTLISMYSKCGMIAEAMKFLEEMDFKDSVSYNALISGSVQNGIAEYALQIFHKMQLSRVEPEIATMMGLLPACSHMAALRHGYCCHAYSIVRGFTCDLSIANALIDMYAKCGRISVARLVFDQMHKRDVVSWNAMIIGYGIHGHGAEAISLFEDMTAAGQRPDEVTFVGLLAACSHSGLVAEGKHWFWTMNQEFGIVPRIDHYLCIVDLLGRGGLLDEAYKFIQQMPLEPDVRIWNALLSACKVYKKIELVEEVSNKIQNLGPESPGNFVLLSNIYGAMGRWEDAAQIRVMQKGLGFRKSPGSSWIEVNGVVHAFVGGDQSHPHSVKINEKLLQLLAEMKKLGYSAEPDFVYQDVEGEEKENILLYHSEKLAVAFGLLNLIDKKPILVTKNLRVCGDCHAALKYISIVTKRDITLRDTVRFHHFQYGTCSCGDFW